MMSESEYYNDEAKFLGAAGLLVRDERYSLLLVKPVYKDVWHLPGGMLEENESPRNAVRREVLEEIGIEIPVGRIVCIDYKSALPGRPACLQFIFDGGMLSEEQMRAISIDSSELEDWRLFPENEALGLVAPGGPAARIANSLDALKQGTTVYLEDGQLKEC
ncbi:NUDIX hydrolase [Plantactinospora sp. BB1]|uniref:NUDIX domain-containing protein n=1 Tax=Plantactinospora sp. BB1 TaxID=2071627 RepID=UPI000D1668CE|nr:NUDIX hydrolase [Plantactinospora sp. BB1]AVT39318.1 NUDIX hydrolase [Plantactinospora sp. BB1]